MSASSRPYLFRGLYDWMTDNNLTPQVLVDVSKNGVVVPDGYVNNEQIVLNIAISATKNLVLGDDAVSFNARFGGKAYDIYLPMEAIVAIFARESDAGMAFGSEPALTEAEEAPSRPSLKSSDESNKKTAAKESAKRSSTEDDGKVIHVKFGDNEQADSPDEPA